MKFKYIFLIILLTPFVLLGFTPTILSTNFGKNLFLKKTKIGTIEKLQVSWLKPQRIEGADLKLPGGNTLEFTELTTTRGLLYELLSRSHFGGIKIVKPLINWKISEETPTSTGTNLPRPIAYWLLKKRASLEISDGQINLRKKGSTITLSELNLFFDKSHTDLFSLKLDSNCDILRAPRQSRGKMSIELTSSLKTTGDYKASFYFTEIPFDFFIPFIENKEWRHALIAKPIGETFSGKFISEIKNRTGTADLLFTASGFHALLVSNLTNGILTLDKEFQSEILLTPQLSDLLLTGINPLTISDLKSEKPISIRIDPNGFSLPLLPLDITKMHAPNVRINLGRVSCTNQGAFSKILTLFGGRTIGNNHEIKLWFAPMDLHIKSGAVNVERTEILINNRFDVALWGDISFPKDRVDLTLGLTEDCL